GHHQGPIGDRVVPALFGSRPLRSWLKLNRDKALLRPTRAANSSSTSASSIANSKDDLEWSDGGSGTGSNSLSIATERKSKWRVIVWPACSVMLWNPDGAETGVHPGSRTRVRRWEPVNRR